MVRHVVELYPNTNYEELAAQFDLNVKTVQIMCNVTHKVLNNKYQAQKRGNGDVTTMDG
jgi:ribosomal protein S17E